jgi:beta-glucanase (GH16 family)
MNIRTAAILLIASFAGLYGCTATRKGTGETDGYKLVWADEFNSSGRVDTANWSFERGLVRNEELQWYSTENAWCENGLLVIEGRREQTPNPGYEAGSTEWRKNRQSSPYTASSIHTNGKHTWQYGRFVMRGRINISPGMWPAWWTLGVSGKWPANGEIDIMEYYRNKLLANVACLDSNGKPEWFVNTYAVDSMGGAAWAAAFHVWRMDWDETSITLFCDDQLLNKVELQQLTNKDGSGINPFKQPHYMLLNLAIGGTNGGDPANTQFPARFEVDYVRVYQKR